MMKRYAYLGDRITGLRSKGNPARLCCKKTVNVFGEEWEYADTI